MGFEVVQDDYSRPRGKHAKRPQAQAQPSGAGGVFADQPMGSEKSRVVDHVRDGYQPTYPSMPPKKKRSKAKVALLIVLVAILVMLIGLGIAVALYLNSINGAISNKDAVEAQEVREALQAPKESPNANEKDAFYTLILGSDARDMTEASRSDVIILARIVPGEKKVTMISIPRDTKVEIPGHGTQKINAAYAFGGASGAIEAVSSFAGVPITHYAEIHFKELEDLVDKLGGVWVDVPVSNDETGASNTGTQLSSGYQLLNGSQALALSRERYGYVRGDFQRSENQRLVAAAIMKQVLSKPAAELPGAVQDLASTVTTDMSATDIISLASKFQGGDMTIYSAMAPSSTATIDGVSYVISDQAGWNAMMSKVDSGEDPNA